ncbi:MAG: glycosyltransferase [Candidatus Levybacteria bacterium]|nr:glycosyltransferase [Candidatus Levybacteria bacterium]
MKIGVDISQTAYKNTGVSQYLTNLVDRLTAIDIANEYIFFFSSLRQNPDSSLVERVRNDKRISLRRFFIPQSLLAFLWNTLHIAPLEWFVGDVDIFITSDWTEPPAKKAKKVTILYDLIVYKFPQETDGKIVSVQKRKLAWVKKESEKILCISEATKKDAQEILGIEPERLVVTYPGI